MRTLTTIVIAVIVVMMIGGMTFMRTSHTAPKARLEGMSALDLMSKTKNLPVTEVADAF